MCMIGAIHESQKFAEPITCNVTLAAEEGPSTAQFLHYPVEIRGIYPEGQTIFIQQYLCSG